MTIRRAEPRGRRHRRCDREDPRADRVGRMGSRDAAPPRGRPRQAARPLAQLAARGGSRALARAGARGAPGRRHVRQQPRAGRAARADALGDASAARPYRPRAVRGAADARAGGGRNGGAARRRRSDRRAAARTRPDGRGRRPRGRARRGGCRLPRRDRAALRATACCVRCCRSLSTSTVRARLWHGMADRGALDLAREEHARIYEAIAAGDADLARAATLLHIATTRPGCASTSVLPTTCRSTVTERAGYTLT